MSNQLLEHLNSAVTLHMAGNIEQASHLYKQLLLDYPKSGDVHNLYGCLLKQQSLYEESLHHHQMAVSIAPHNPDFLHNLANCFLLLSRHEEAIYNFEQSLLIRPDSCESLYLLGQSLAKINRVGDAIACLKRSLSIDKTSSQAWYFLGILYRSAKKYDLAIQCFDCSIALLPSCYASNLAKADLLQAAGNIHEAISLLSNYLDANNQSEDMCLRLANLYCYQKNYIKAKICFENALRISPNSPQTLHEYGTCLVSLKLYDEASLIAERLCDLSISDTPDSVKVPLPGCQLHGDLLSRLYRHKSWDLKINIATSSRPTLSPSIVKTITSSVYPSPYIASNDKFLHGKHDLFISGYHAQHSIISSVISQTLIEQCSNFSYEEFLEYIYSVNILQLVLDNIYGISGLRHLAFSCGMSAKSHSDNKNISNKWHYDNDFTASCSKLMIYLNPKTSINGATEFIDIQTSNFVSDNLGYRGLPSQRSRYDEFYPSISQLLADSRPDSFFRFSPDEVGSGIYFLPSNVLHRGVCPTSGVRFVLTFGLCPIPSGSEMNSTDCIDKSMQLLKSMPRSTSYNCCFFNPFLSF